MSKRRNAGDWIWLMPNSGFVGESHRLKAEIQPEDDPSPCMFDCDDDKCAEWSTLLTEEDGDRGRHTLCHVSECQMLDEPFRDEMTQESSSRANLHSLIALAMAAHPCLRMGQLVWTAAFMARKQAKICSEGDGANVFYITDEAMAEGLNAMAREKSLPGDKVTQLAEKIKSYLTRKIGASLDGETMDHISKLIRDA